MSRNRIIRPAGSSKKPLIRPTTPFEARMIAFAEMHDVPPEDSLEGMQLKKLMAMDVALQMRLKTLQKRLPHIFNSRTKNGSGLQMSWLLRDYFIEYFDRYLKHGPHHFPTSFNVVESFMVFDRENWFFDLRPEAEHLLSINDYFEFYSKSPFPLVPEMLLDVMQEGVIYSFDLVSTAGSPRICNHSKQVLAGVSLIRRAHELSSVLLAGENPPQTPDAVIERRIGEGFGKSHKGISPHPDLTTKDRYLGGFPDFAKVIVMTRFDLKARAYGVRYVNLDLGPSFTVYTDDSTIFPDLPEMEIKRLKEIAIGGLSRYDDLFGALSSMIYLPAIFAALPDRVCELQVATTLGSLKDDARVSELVRELGKEQCPMERTIRCLLSNSNYDGKSVERIEPPELRFKNDGYWKTIGPQEIGEGQSGEQIFGRTWVARHETWSARSPQSFLVERKKHSPAGPDPGVIYVQRSAAHEPGLYKVGLTRRSSAIRARELSSATGVPLPFGVLADWSVGDCARVEREIHKRLEAHRLSPRREFFRCELTLITRTIGLILDELGESK